MSEIKEVITTIERAVNSGQAVKVTIEIQPSSNATWSHHTANQQGSVPPPAPPPRKLQPRAEDSFDNEKNPFEPRRESEPIKSQDKGFTPRPQVRYVNEGGCLAFIVAGVSVIGTILYIL